MQKLTTDIINELKTKPGFVYLATPYTLYHYGLASASDMACVAAAYLINQGLNVYCPIAHSHAIS